MSGITKSAVIIKNGMFVLVKMDCEEQWAVVFEDKIYFWNMCFLKDSLAEVKDRIVKVADVPSWGTAHEIIETSKRYKNVQDIPNFKIVWEREEAKPEPKKKYAECFHIGGYQAKPYLFEIPEGQTLKHYDVVVVYTEKGLQTARVNKIRELSDGELDLYCELQGAYRPIKKVVCRVEEYIEEMVNV